MKAWRIKILETILDDFELDENEIDQVRNIIKTWHVMENTSKALGRRETILRLKFPDVYAEIMDNYTEKYGRVYTKGDDDDAS